MNTLKIFLVSLCFALLCAGMAASEIYQWTDENGEIHFSDHPPEDSGPTRNLKVVPTDGSETQPKTGVKGEANPADKLYPQKVPKVELYTTNWCIYCKKARNFLLSRGIPFTEYDIEKDENAARRKRRLDTERGVPFAVINGQHIRGFSEAAYEQALQGGR